MLVLTLRVGRIEKNLSPSLHVFKTDRLRNLGYLQFLVVTRDSKVHADNKR